MIFFQYFFNHLKLLLEEYIVDKKYFFSRKNMTRKENFN